MSVQITLSVKDDGTATIKQVEGELKKLRRAGDDAAQGLSRGFRELGKDGRALVESLKKNWSEFAAAGGQLVESFKQNWFEITAATGAAVIAVNQVWAAAKGGAEFEEAQARLSHQLAGTNASVTSLIPALKELTANQLSNADATKLASQGLAAGLNVEQLKTFTQLAEVTSDVLGMSIPQAMDTLLTSMATGRTTMLKQIGIVVDLEAETEKLAKATGREASAVTDAEKQHILLNAVMDQSSAAMGRLSDGTVSAADKFTAFEARVSDARLALGQLAKDAAVEVLDAFGPRGVLSGFNPANHSIEGLVKPWRDLGDAIAGGGEARQAAEQEALGHGIVEEAIGKRIVAETKLAVVEQEAAARQDAARQNDFWTWAAEREKAWAAETAAATGEIAKQTGAMEQQAQTAAQWGVAFGDSAAVAAGGVERVTRSLDALGNKQMEAYALVTGQAASMGEDRPWNGRYDTPNNAPLSRPGSIGGPLDNPQDMFSLTPTGAGDFNSGVRPTILEGVGGFRGLDLGGIVPMARGGDVEVRRPTLFLAGEAGPERASFTPLGTGGGSSPTYILNFYGPTDEEYVRNKVVPALRSLERSRGKF